VEDYPDIGTCKTHTALRPPLLQPVNNPSRKHHPAGLKSGTWPSRANQTLNACKPRFERGSSISPVVEAVGTDADGEQTLVGRVVKSLAYQRKYDGKESRETKNEGHSQDDLNKMYLSKQKENNNQSTNNQTP
jgi:hypothetical protein